MVTIATHAPHLALHGRQAIAIWAHHSQEVALIETTSNAAAAMRMRRDRAATHRFGVHPTSKMQWEWFIGLNSIVI